MSVQTHTSGIDDTNNSQRLEWLLAQVGDGIARDLVIRSGPISIARAHVLAANSSFLVPEASNRPRSITDSDRPSN